MKKKIKNKNGLTLMEVIISLGVLMLLIMGVYSLIVLSLQLNSDNERYVVGIEIANQKMEYIRNLAYSDVGVVGGIPSGLIPPVETIERNNNFTIYTYITYYPDEYDGLSASSTPADPIVNDYKIATVKVEWLSKLGPKNITLFSKIIPRTMETDEGYGLLRIVVSDVNAQPIVGADVRVVNNSLIPPVDTTNPTDSNGVLYLPAATSTQAYEITVTKTDEEISGIYYGTDQTYHPSTGKSPYHLTITEGNMTEEGFTIDKLGLLSIRTVSNNLPANWQINQNSEARNQYKPRISLDNNDNMYFTWESGNATSSYVYIQKYNSAAVKQWASDKKIITSKFQSNPDIVTADSGVSYVVWQDNASPLLAFHNNHNRLAIRAKTNPQGLNYGLTAMTAPVNMIFTEDSGYFYNNPIYPFFFPEQKKFFSNLLQTFNLVLKPGLIFIKPPFANAAGPGLTVNKYTGSMSGTSRDFNISPVTDTSKTFVLMQSWWTTGNSNRREADEHQTVAYLLNNNTIRLERDNSNGSSYFSFYVIEAPNDEFIVRKKGQITITNGNTFNTDSVSGIIDDSKVVIFANSRSDNSSYNDNDGGYATVELTGSGPTWTINAERNDNTSNCYVRYAVVEWLASGISVQTDEFDGNVGVTEVTDTIPVAVDTSRTWLYSTMRYSQNGLAQTSVRAYLKDANTIGYIRRYNTYNAGIRWWAIEFPAGVTVQRGSDQAASGDTEENQTITAVDLSASWSDSYRACNGGGTAFPRDRWEETLTAPTNLRWSRLYNGQVVDFSWQVIDTSAWTTADDVTVIATGTQVYSIITPNTDEHIGGAFVITDNTGTRDVTSVTITENGTVDAQTDLDNIKLVYDLDQNPPYDCFSVSFSGDELPFGGVDTDGFSAANGTSTFSASINISTTKTLCLYVVLDVLASAPGSSTIEIKINDPASDVTVDSGTVASDPAVEIPGATYLLRPADLEQIHYRWRDDDGSEATADWTANQDTPITIIKNSLIRLRFEISNEGSLTSDPTQYRLEYGENTGSCGSIPELNWTALPYNNTQHWRIASSSYLTDGNSTTNVFPGLDDENGNFITGEIKDANNQTSAITLTSSQFTEIEYAINATDNASDANSYCFRLTDAGTPDNFSYIIYPEASIVGDDNIYLMALDSFGNELWAVKRVNNYINENQTYPRIAMTENFGTATTVVVWQDNRNGNYDIYAQSLSSIGERLWLNDLRITSSSTDEYSPVVAIDNTDTIIVAWVDYGISSNDIYLQKYDLDGNQLWVNHRLVANSSFDEYEPALLTDSSNNIYVSWTEYATGINNTYLAKFDSSATKLWETPTNLESPTANQTEAGIALNNANIFSSWTDNREGNNDIFTQKFDLNGNAQWSEDFRINIELSSSTQEKSALIINSVGTTFAAWHDNRDGNFNIYAAEFNAPGTVSGESNVPIRVFGTKTISETPPIFEYDEIHVTDASGYTDIMVESEALGYSLELVAASTSLDIIFRDPVQPLTLLPDETINWLIYVE